MMPVIFSVEDDSNIRHVMKIALENAGYDVRLFSEGASFLKALESMKPDLVLLDLMLPETDGLTLLETIRKHSRTKNIPVLIVSAKSSELEKVIGLDSGADDYLVKPFGVLELVSRVKALLRRTFPMTSETVVETDRLRLLPDEQGCFLDDERLGLTAKEFALLFYLVKHEGKTLTREDILDHVWGYDFFGETRTLDVHIKNLREKLRDAGMDDCIETVRGVGYRFES
jgi:two-component system alkaline phosphatase synthesis response regulator PhoP